MSRTSRRKTDLDRRLRREMRAERRAELDRRRGRLRRRIGWPLTALGGLVFVLSYFGALTGQVALPWDQHHQFGQIAGGVLVAVGVIIATSGGGSKPVKHRDS